MSELSFNEYAKDAHKTAVYIKPAEDAAKFGDPEWLLKLSYAVMGLTGEAGEFANKAKKIIRDYPMGEMPQEKRQAMIDELGDVLWYVNEVSGFLGVSLTEVAARNLVKLQARQETGSLHGDGDKERKA